LQFSQNVVPSGFSWPHTRQTITGLPLRRAARSRHYHHRRHRVNPRQSTHPPSGRIPPPSATIVALRTEPRTGLGGGPDRLNMISRAMPTGSHPGTRVVSPIVLARLRVPVTTALSRERIEARLAQIWRHRVGFVVAPAGSGKTTLLGSFAAATA